MDILNWLKSVSRGPRPIPGLSLFAEMDLKKWLLLKKIMSNFMAEYGTAIITPKIADYISSVMSKCISHISCEVKWTADGLVWQIGLPTFQIIDVNNEKAKCVFQEKSN